MYVIHKQHARRVKEKLLSLGLKVSHILSSIYPNNWFIYLTFDTFLQIAPKLKEKQKEKREKPLTKCTIAFELPKNLKRLFLEEDEENLVPAKGYLP